MGVWISGFFGSGKSHFLKILSYLLENKQVGDKHALDFFIDDKKITNQMVLADMKLAADTPTDVILFNIDSKSESNSKENKDAIVNVFLKVFNEMQGFCGSMPYLADLERHLAEADQLATFKEKFEDAYGDAWEDSRQDFDFIQDTVVEVLVEMGFMSEPAARNWCEKATEPYQISIEDFAKRVKAYLDKKGSNHHVVFLVDEIGQYIGDDSKLMLPGSGKFERTGLGSDRDCRESTNTAFNFLKANGNRISGGISTASKDYIINYQDLQGIGMTGKLALPTLIALCSIALGRPTVSTLAVLGEISISGTILKVDELANSLQVCLDSGAKKVLLPITSAADLGTVPPELVGSFNLIFYSSAEDAVFKALGVE